MLKYDEYLTCNFDLAKRFLEYLDKNAQKFCFQPYKSKFARAPIIDTLEGAWFEICKLDAAEFNISVAINDTDGERRNTENVTRIRAVWQDDDGCSASDNYPLPPSVVVQTSSGKYHRYWLVEDYWPTDEQGRADFKAVMSVMTDVHGNDPQARDISRVMRLPGTFHRKQEPTRAMILFPQPGDAVRRYRRAEILTAFVGDEVKPRPVLIQNSECTADECDFERVRSAMKFIPADGREEWLIVGMALHHWTGGDAKGFAIWEEWSRTSTKFNEQEQQRQWKSFRNHSNPRTIASIFGLASRLGWSENFVAKPKSQLPISRVEPRRRPRDLVERTLVDVKTTFDRYGCHRPSDSHYDGLAQITSVVQAMADGDTALERDFFVSYLPTGMGKSTTVIGAVRNLVEMPEYDDVGVIVFLARVEEIEKYAREMKLGEAQYSVIVSGNYQDKVQTGNPSPENARVLFTTQQMLEAHLKGKKQFADIRPFEFRGRPRQVRIWDEAILPSKSLTVGQYDITNMYRALINAGHRELVIELEKLFESVKAAKDRSILQMPDLTVYGVEMEEARNEFSVSGDRDTVEALWGLSGRTVRVRKDNRGNAVLDYEDVFPDDLGPLLILGASSHLRQIYRFWYYCREGLRFLPSPGKSYSGLTIHHWDRGAGKDKYKRKNPDRLELYEGIISAINSIPRKEKVLVVHFKENRQTADVEKEVRERLPWSGNVDFCTWGRHTATNDYADCKHVILASVLQYSVPQNEAFGRGAMKLRTEDEFAEPDYRSTRIGEIEHNIFQAGCQGAVRNAEGNSCPQGCHLYIIFSTHAAAGIPKDVLHEVFPGATVENWKPVAKLSKLQRKICQVLLSAEPGDSISKKELVKQVDIKGTTSNLNRVLDENVDKFLAERGVLLDVLRGYVRTRKRERYKYIEIA